MGKKKLGKKVRPPAKPRSRANGKRLGVGDKHQNETVEAGQNSQVGQILALQNQIGNRKVSSLLSEGEPGMLQRTSAAEMAREARELLAENKEERDKVHEFEADTYEELSARARKLADRLNNILESNYNEMVKDETGMKAINVAGQVEKYIKWAFKADESYADEYIGPKNLPIVLEQIDATPGLYEKLGLLRAMEPWHARYIGLKLKIPPLKGFNYKMTTVSAGGGDDIAASASIIMISCEQEGTKLWEQSYLLSAFGVSEGISAEDITITAAQGTFETLVYWGPDDFKGQMRFAGVSGGFIYGYSFGVGTFLGDGSKGSLTIDMSGEIATTGELGVGAFIGLLTGLGEANKHAGPKTKKMEHKPKILVYDDIDKTMKVPFPEGSAESGGTLRNDFVDLLKDAVKSDDLTITITGKSSIDSPYNVSLMKDRMKHVREIINQVRQEQEVEGPAGDISENEEVGEAPPGKQDHDPNRDRAVAVHLKGRIVLKKPAG